MITPNFIITKYQYILKAKSFDRSKQKLMEGQTLPRATMLSFVKKNTKMIASTEFIYRLIHLSKEYIVKISDKSNEICENNNKKTINFQHLATALEGFKLAHQIEDLKQLGNMIKESNDQKRQANKMLEESIERQREEQKKMKQLQRNEKKKVLVRQQFDQFQESNNFQLSCDYQELARESEYNETQQQAIQNP